MTPSSNNLIVGLTGFLGRPTDWDLIPGLMPDGWRLNSVNLWQKEILSDYESFANILAEKVLRESAGAPKKVLMGYSLGGRLALHTLIRNPGLFDAAVIISAHPGLQSEDERRLRRQTDEVWASKFAREPWPQLMQEWNAQAVLKTSSAQSENPIVLERHESEFDRHLLSEALSTWSLGRQRDLRKEISEITTPIQFITGAHDLKYTDLARAMLAAPSKGLREHAVIENAGHRVPWDAPPTFRTVLAKYLARW